MINANKADMSTPIKADKAHLEGAGRSMPMIAEKTPSPKVLKISSLNRRNPHYRINGLPTPWANSILRRWSDNYKQGGQVNAEKVDQANPKGAGMSVPMMVDKTPRPKGKKISSLN